MDCVLLNVRGKVTPDSPFRSFPVIGSSYQFAISRDYVFPFEYYHHARATGHKGRENDTSVFRTGSGQDRIIDYDPLPDNIDRIWMGSDISPGDMGVKRVGDDLVLKVSGPSDSVTIKNYFWNDSPLWQVERIEFVEGTGVQGSRGRC